MDYVIAILLFLLIVQNAVDLHAVNKTLYLILFEIQEARQEAKERN